MEPEGLFASAADADGVDQFAADHSTEQLAGAKRNALRDKTKCRRVRHAKSAAGHSWPPGSLPARVDAWPASPRRFQRVLDRRDDGGHVRTVSMGGASAAVLLRGLRAKAQGHADEDPISAQSCKVEFRSARRDARFCSDACGKRTMRNKLAALDRLWTERRTSSSRWRSATWSEVRPVSSTNDSRCMA